MAKVTIVANVIDVTKINRDPMEIMKTTVITVSLCHQENMVVTIIT